MPITHHPTTLNFGFALTTISICCLSESVSSNSFPSTSPNGTPNEENTLTSPPCTQFVQGSAKCPVLIVLVADCIMLLFMPAGM